MNEVIEMNKNVSINLRVNSEVKKEAEEILASMGLTLSESFNMLLHQINLKKKIPFSIDANKDYTVDDLNYAVREHIAEYESGKEKVNGPYSNLDDLWESMDI